MSLASECLGLLVGSGPDCWSGASVLYSSGFLRGGLLEVTKTDKRRYHEGKAEQRYQPAECKQASGANRETDQEKK